MTETQWQTTKELIKKYDISHKILRELLIMNRSVFSEKMKESRTYHFTDIEKDKITNYLLCMGRVLVENFG